MNHEPEVVQLETTHYPLRLTKVKGKGHYYRSEIEALSANKFEEVFEMFVEKSLRPYITEDLVKAFSVFESAVIDRITIRPAYIQSYTHNFQHNTKKMTLEVYIGFEDCDECLPFTVEDESVGNSYVCKFDEVISGVERQLVEKYGVSSIQFFDSLKKYKRSSI